MSARRDILESFKRNFGDIPLGGTITWLIEILSQLTDKMAEVDDRLARVERRLGSPEVHIGDRYVWDPATMQERKMTNDDFLRSLGLDIPQEPLSVNMDGSIRVSIMTETKKEDDHGPHKSSFILKI